MAAERGEGAVLIGKGCSRSCTYWESAFSPTYMWQSGVLEIGESQWLPGAEWCHLDLSKLHQLLSLLIIKRYTKLEVLPLNITSWPHTDCEYSLLACCPILLSPSFLKNTKSCKHWSQLLKFLLLLDLVHRFLLLLSLLQRLQLFFPDHLHQSQNQ